MEKLTFKINNITCGHCVATIQNELKELDGVSNVAGDPQNKTITVEWDTPATVSVIEDKFNEIGYPATN